MSRPDALMLAAVLGAAACGGDDALPEGAFAFDGTDISPVTDDLEPLWRIIGDARLIGLGESVHTSGGFYAAKHRLIRALVEERGVRAVAFESPRGRVRALDQYVRSGACDRPAKELFGISIFEVFVDDNTYAMVRWLCERNAAAPDDPVRLFGFDIQQPDEDSAEIRTFLETHAPGDAPGLLAGISTCAALYSDTTPTEAEHTACVQGLVAIDAWFPPREAQLIAAAGERTVRMFELARVSWRAMQDAYYLENDRTRSYEPRDLGMGAVFRGVLALDFPPDARVAIWAHNVHLARNHDRVLESPYNPGAVTFGTVVQRDFGADYAPVAITGHAPGTNWPQIGMVTEHSFLGRTPGSVERQLHELREPYLIVDPRAAFLEPDLERSFNDETMIPSEQFAAIVYLDRSPMMDAVFW